MFTGLVETKGIIKSIEKSNDVWVLTLKAPNIYPYLKLGDSVSIMGACCTVMSLECPCFSVEIMNETIKKTKFSELQEGEFVNLERAMLLTSRLDGHLVSGHIDGTGKILKIESFTSTKILYLTTTQEILLGIVPKGSITIDGVSLTVVDVTAEFFSVSLIPTTIKDTTLSNLSLGDTVNLETDIIGKYVKRFLNITSNEPSNNEPLTYDKLSEYGW